MGVQNIEQGDIGVSGSGLRSSQKRKSLKANSNDRQRASILNMQNALTCKSARKRQTPLMEKWSKLNINIKKKKYG